MANLPVVNLAVYPATSAQQRAGALRACLVNYTRSAQPQTFERDLDDVSRLVSMHERETLRLVAVLTTHLSAAVPVDPTVAEPAPVGLTRREIEVLDAIADGLSTMQIAALLHISVNTARNHVQRIFEKLGVHSRLQAVKAAVHLGLLQRLAG